MDYKHIETLVDKYFEGETSLQEETQLKDYFTKEHIHPSLEMYQGLFQYWVDESQVTLDDAFDIALLEKIEAQEAADSSASAKPKKGKVILLRTRMLYRVAAAIALVMTAWWSYQTIDKAAIEKNQTAIDWSEYEPQSVEEAEKLLAEAFSKINKEEKKQSIDWSQYEPKTVEEAMELTTKAFQKLSTEVTEGTSKATKEVSKVGELNKFFE
ncbi:MAG: hypothetical protein MK226_08695 [Saprospiraceae bacterium]|nr:hypothetical protein [Saprospiraceae bacterium]